MPPANGDAEARRMQERWVPPGACVYNASALTTAVRRRSGAIIGPVSWVPPPLFLGASLDGARSVELFRHRDEGSLPSRPARHFVGFPFPLGEEP